MVYNPSTDNLVQGVPADISRTLRRRYFLVDKAKNANIIGKPPEPPPCMHAQDSLRHVRAACQALLWPVSETCFV